MIIHRGGCLSNIPSDKGAKNNGPIPYPVIISVSAHLSEMLTHHLHQMEGIDIPSTYSASPSPALKSPTPNRSMTNASLDT